MNYSGKLGSSGLDSLSNAHVDLDSASHRGGADSVTVPDAHLLFSGDFQRSGSDLIISDDHHRVVVPDYFQGSKRPMLVSPEGAPLDPKVVEALTGHTAYAQAGGAPAAKVVGHVASQTGSASVVRNGVTVVLNNGDAVYQSDVVQTGSGSTLGLVLIDGTTFKLAANARLMLNDLTYDATSTSNSALFTLVQGAASFVAGQVAKTGDMKVGTPIATMGIRGTAVILDISSTDGRVSISVVDQRDGLLHSVQVYNTRGDLIGTVTSNGSTLTLTPTATFEVIAQESNKTVLQIAQEFNAFQTLLGIYDIQKQIDPNLPQHTDNNANPKTQHAAPGSPSPDSPQTVTLNPATSPFTTKVEPNGTTTTVVFSTQSGGTPGGTSSGPGFADTTFDQPLIIPAASAPFVVTAPTVSRISSGPGDHFGPVMSADGRFVTYDPDGAIYLFDRSTGTTITIQSPAGGLTFGSPTISGDGHFIVYQRSDGVVFLYNNNASDAANYQHVFQIGAGTSPAISGDGSVIVVERGGASLVGLDQQGHTLFTITPTSAGVSGALWKPAISADGHLVVFWDSDAASAGGSGHLMAFDRSTGQVTLIGSTAHGAGATAASVSADGHFITYQSDVSGHSEIYLYDVTKGQVVFHTANASGGSYNPVISPDGHFIIFASDAKLTGNDTNSVADAYVVDVTNPANPVFKLVSLGADGVSGNAASDLGGTISLGGHFIAFGSNASNFSSGDNNGSGDIFVVDPSSGRDVIIQEDANSPAILTAGGVIAITGGITGVSIFVSDPSHFSASFSPDGQSIIWSYSEPKSNFDFLSYGQEATRPLVITLNSAAGTLSIPVNVTIHDSVPNAAPVITSANLTVSEGGTVAFGPGNIGISDADDSSFTFKVFVAHGQFQVLVGGQWYNTATFTSAELAAGAVRFLHDGTEFAPSFAIQADDGHAANHRSNMLLASVNFTNVNDAPVIKAATLQVVRGGTVTLGASNLFVDHTDSAASFSSYPTRADLPAFASGATVVDNWVGAQIPIESIISVNDPDSSSFTFKVTNVTHGVFQVPVGDNWVAATTFTSADLNAGHVRFVREDSEAIPTFSIQADDGSATNHAGNVFTGTVKDPSIIVINTAPVITAASLTVSEGNTIILKLADIAVTDPENSSFTFTVSNVSYGTFQTTTDGIHWVNATQFTTADLNASHVRFVHDGGEAAPTFSIQANDGSAGGNVFTGSVSFTNVNDAPTATPVTLASGTEDVSYTITSSMLLTGVTDPDGPSALSITDLCLTSGGGSLVDNDDGTWTYIPAHGYNGPVSFNYKVSDGALTSHSTASLSLAAVNDAPAVSGPVTGTVTEDGTPGFLNALANASDIDDDTLAVVNVPAELPAGVSYNSGLQGFILDPTNTVFQYLAAGDTATVTVNYGISDGHVTVPGSVSWTIHGVNDAPEYAGSDLATAWHAGDEPVALIHKVSASDVDSENYAGGTLTATVTDGGHEGDTLSIVGNEHISLTVASGTFVMYDSDGYGGDDPVVIGTLTHNGDNSLTVALNDNADDAAVAALTEAIAFSNSLADPVSGTRTVTFTLQDGGGTANGAHDFTRTEATVTVGAASNHLATIDGDTTGDLVEDATASGGIVPLDTVSGVLTVHDIDDGQDHFQPVDLEALNGTYGQFTFNSDNGHWTYHVDSSSFQWLGSGATVTDTLTVTSADGSAEQDITVTITGTNDAPEFSGKGFAPTYETGGDPVALVHDVTVSDIDSAHYTGGSLTAAVSDGRHDGDTLSIDETQYISLIVASGTTVMYDADGDGPGGAVSIGTLSYSGDGGLTVSLNGNADDAAVAALTEAIQFSNSLDNPGGGTRTVTFTLQDGGGTANGGHDTTHFDATVDVPSTNVTPAVAGDMSIVAVKGGGEVALTVADLGAIDPDTDPAEIVFTIDDLNHGRLAFGEDRVQLSVDDTFTLADVQAGQVFYQSVGDYVGQDHVRLTLADDGSGAATSTVILGATIVDAQVTVLTDAGFDFEQDNPIGKMGSGIVALNGDASDHSFRILNSAAHTDFYVTGYDFSYDDNNGLTGGTITSILEVTSGDDHTPIARFDLSVPAADWYNAVIAAAYGDQSKIEALTQSWTFNFVGNAGADAFAAGDVNDIFTGRAGDDTLDGQFGYDRANYGGAEGSIAVDLAAGMVAELSADGQQVTGIDTLRSVELVTGSNHDDVFEAIGFDATSPNAGSTVTNNVLGLFNEFEGLGGDDLIAGNGQTRISYYHATSGVVVDFDANSWTGPTSGVAGTVTGNASVGTDHFTGVNSVRGSNFDDVFTGGNNPSQTSENFEGMGGDDFIDGNGGFDRAIYSLAADNQGITVYLAYGSVTGGIDSGSDTLRSVEAVWGTNFSDYYDATGFGTFSQNAGTAGVNAAGIAFNEFEGGGGNDTVIGNGNTRVVFYHSTGGVIVRLADGNTGSASGNASVGHDTLDNGVTSVRGSEFSDQITGNSLNNTLEGQGGNDLIYGKGGNDILTGGGGADVFQYVGNDGNGNTTLSNNDVITDFNRAQGDIIDLSGNSSLHSLADVLAHTDFSTGNAVITFTTVTGQPATLTVNGVTSFAESDFLFAGQVGVRVMTPDGYDFSTLYDDLAGGHAVVADGTNANRFYIVNPDAGLTYVMQGGGFTYDSDTHLPTSGTIGLINIFQTTDPSQISLDNMVVNSAGWLLSANSLFTALDQYNGENPGAHASGLAGLDALFGSATYRYLGTDGIVTTDGPWQDHSGADTFLAGNHADIFNGLAGPFGGMDPGNDTVDYSHAGTGVTVNLLTGATAGTAAAGDIFVSIENLRGSDFADTLTGDGNNNVIEGGLGNDVLDGGGNGFGTDTVSYAHASDYVTVDLRSTAQQDTHSAGFDTLSNFEAVLGSAYNDTLIGGGSNILEGGAGNDHLIGQPGEDVTASYEHATSGVTVDLGITVQQFTRGAGSDTLTDIANLAGSHFNDRLTGDAHDNIFLGNGGNDSFVFKTEDGVGHDTIGDFASGQDKIELDYAAFDPNSPGDFTAWYASHVSQQGNGDLLIDLNGRDSILLKNASIGGLSANDFILHPGGGGIT